MTAANGLGFQRRKAGGPSLHAGVSGNTSRLARLSVTSHNNAVTSTGTFESITMR